MDMCKKTGVDIFDAMIDTVHRIREAYFNNKRKKNFKSIIARFTIFMP